MVTIDHLERSVKIYSLLTGAVKKLFPEMSLHVGQSHHITVPTDFLHPPIRCRDLTRIRVRGLPNKVVWPD